jgi:hypothetical protein
MSVSPGHQRGIMTNVANRRADRSCFRRAAPVSYRRGQRGGVTSRVARRADLSCLRHAALVSRRRGQCGGMTSRVARRADLSCLRYAAFMSLCPSRRGYRRAGRIHSGHNARALLHGHCGSSPR